MPTSYRDTPDEIRAEATDTMSDVTTKMKASNEEMIVNAHTKFNAIPSLQEKIETECGEA